jgi:selenide,water dikinase
VGPGDLRVILDAVGGSLGAAGGPSAPRDLLVGTETGDDAAVYRLNDTLALVLTTDFITPVCDDPYLYGQVAASNALSDVFAMGGVPLVALAVCGFPEALDSEQAAEICAGGAAKAAEAHAVVAGGHTMRNPELFYGLGVTGTVSPRRIVRNSGARPGDALVLTKPLGTGLVINAARAGKLDESKLLAACRVMAALNGPAAGLMVERGAHAATDVTGFGLAGHALGLATASGVSIRFALDRLPIFPDAPGLAEAGVTSRGARQNRDAFEPHVRLEGAPARTGLEALLYDPQTAGGLLVAIDGDRAPAFVEELHRRGVPAAAIVGECLPAPAEGEARLRAIGG